MRGKSFLLAGLLILAAASALVYILWTGPMINSPLGFDLFDEARVRAQVTTISKAVLQTGDSLVLSLDHDLNGDILRKMQILFGISAANHWAHEEVPAQVWEYSFRERSGLTGSFTNQEDPLLQIRVSSNGVPQSMVIKTRAGDLAELSRTTEEARKVALDLMRILGVNPADLILTATQSRDENGEMIHEFTWKESLDRIPGLVYIYEATLKKGYITSFRRTVDFSVDLEATVWDSTILPLAAVMAWFFLVLLTIILFVQGLRRDQVDVLEARQIALFSGALALTWFIKNPSGGWVEAVAGGLVAAVFAILFFCFLWIVAESLLRQCAAEKLRLADCLLLGQWNVKEMGRQLLWAWGWGLLLLLIPGLLLFLGMKWRTLGVSMLPPHLELSNLSFPGGLALDVLLRPLPTVAVLGIVFLGILYPLLSVRFSKWISCPLFVALFTVAVTPLLEMIFRPWQAAAATAFLVGCLVYQLMDKFGLLAGIFVLYFPLVVRNVSVLIEAKTTSAQHQGMFALGFLALFFLGTVIVAAMGKEQKEIQEYEPVYLKRMRERERFTRELEIAKGIQERFLPKEIPQIPGFEMACRCVPAMEVGGDAYDFLHLKGNKWLLLIGDVSGKGVRAAFYMTLTKGILHAISSVEPSHQEILKHLNRIFKVLSDDGVFLTLCALVLDPDRRKVRLVSAGHTPPLLVRNGEVEPLQPRGLVLGVMDEVFFLNSLRDVEVTLEDGDVLILYTDGVTEAMNGKGEEFGEERLEDTVRRAAGGGSEEILQAIVEAVARHEGGNPQSDDLTLLVLKADHTASESEGPEDV